MPWLVRLLDQPVRFFAAFVRLKSEVERQLPKKHEHVASPSACRLGLQNFVQGFTAPCCARNVPMGRRHAGEADAFRCTESISKSIKGTVISAGCGERGAECCTLPLRWQCKVPCPLSRRQQVLYEEFMKRHDIRLRCGSHCNDTLSMHRSRVAERQPEQAADTARSQEGRLLENDEHTKLNLITLMLRRLTLGYRVPCALF